MVGASRHRRLCRLYGLAHLASLGKFSDRQRQGTLCSSGDSQGEVAVSRPLVHVRASRALPESAAVLDFRRKAERAVQLWVGAGDRHGPPDPRGCAPLPSGVCRQPCAFHFLSNRVVLSHDPKFRLSVQLCVLHSRVSGHGLLVLCDAARHRPKSHGPGLGLAGGKPGHIDQAGIRRRLSRFVGI